MESHWPDQYASFSNPLEVVVIIALLFKLHLICVLYMCLGIHLPRHTYGGQRPVLFPPLGGLGSNTGPSALAAHTFICWPILPAPITAFQEPHFQIPDAERLPFVNAPSYSVGAPMITARALSTSLTEMQLRC